MSYLNKASDFFRSILGLIGIDVALLAPVIFVGISLAIIFIPQQDTQTIDFAFVFSFLAGIVIVAAFLSKATKLDFFRGANYAIIQNLSPEKYPVLGLVYLIGGTVFGFMLAAANLILTSIMIRAGSFAPPYFVYEAFFSPIVETYFWQCLAVPIVEVFLLYVFRFSLFGSELLAKIVAFSISAFFIGGLAFAFVHLAVTNGDPNLLMTSVAFGIMLAVIARLLGALPAIGTHVGYNSAVLAIQAGLIR